MIKRVISIKNIASAVRDWRHVTGYSNRNIINKSGNNKIVVVEYSVSIPKKYGLHDKKILFFSDIHFGSGDLDIKAFRKMVADVNPDWMVFGGDLITYACSQYDAFVFLHEIASSIPDVAKVAVYGNWDRRRNCWYPNSEWENAYGNIGIRLLVNENIELNGINFYGIDEPRMGTPKFDDTLKSEDKFNCIISHNVDPLIDATSDNQFRNKQLFLCGHSHGGQIRMPLFGAIFTSTKYWKFFEYGHYYSQKMDINLIVTSGIGTTKLPFRLFCEPEVVVVKFDDRPI